MTIETMNQEIDSTGREMHIRMSVIFKEEPVDVIVEQRRQLELGIIDSNQFSRVNRIKFPSNSVCLAVCKASACLLLLVTKRVTVAL